MLLWSLALSALVQIDVRQLFGAAQRPLLDLFDLSRVGVEAALVRAASGNAATGGKDPRSSHICVGGGRRFQLMPLSRIEGSWRYRPNLQARPSKPTEL